MQLGGAWFIAALAVACLGAAGCGPTPISGLGSDGPGPTEPAAKEGAELYRRYCALCHGHAGEGYAADHASQLNNRQFLTTASDPFLLVAIEQGRLGTPMAAYGKRFGGPLGLEEMRKILAFMRSWQTEAPQLLSSEPVLGDPLAGSLVFKERCARCHGERGEGKTAMSVSNPVFLMSASDAFVRHAIVHGRPGTPMPAFGRTLTAGAIDDTTAYLRSLARTVDRATTAGDLPPSFDQVVVNPDGPMPEFPPLRDGRYLAAAVVHRELARGARMVLLDARPTSDWLMSHIPGALPVPYYDANRMSAKLPKDGTWMIAYCGCPHAASGQVMDTLRAAGAQNTAVIDEGIFEWIRRGYPITHGRKPTLGAPIGN
ncbi:MAG: c-type cytochrome [Myxococcales bacterium]|nr:c-type cytochrome [Myxococcales bacterium]